MPLVPHEAVVLVCDGSRAKLLVNRGRPDVPNLEVLEAWEAPDNPASRDQGTGAPGRVFQSADGRRSAVEAPDPHEAAERRFVEDAAERLGRALRDRPDAQAVMVAPPRALSVLREAVSGADARRVVAQVDKDLTRHTLPEMARIIAAS